MTRNSVAAVRRHVQVIDSYAHHPTEMTADLEAAEAARARAVRGP